jgi:hypothetical protein
MTPEEAHSLLATAATVPYAKASLRDARGLVSQLLAAGVPASLQRPDDCCSTGGCGPSFQVLVREEDVPRVLALQRGRWEDALAREGLSAVAPRTEATGEDELPCPACGLAAPLLHGACTDCGLQLE